MHYIQFNQKSATQKSPTSSPQVVRGHHLTEGEIEKVLLELRIPRAANVARISVGPESGFSRVDAEHAIANGV